MEPDGASDDSSDDDEQKRPLIEDTRKSGRKTRPPTSYSPERTDSKRKRVLKKNTDGAVNRKYDLLPNGNSNWVSLIVYIYLIVNAYIMFFVWYVWDM